MSGYNMDCTGPLGMQDCTIAVNTPTGCTTGSPGCTTTHQKVIGITESGGIVSEGKSNSSWMEFVPQLTTLDQNGNAYQPFGPSGIPYTMGGGSTVKWNPMGAGSEQALQYLDTAPGSGAREAYQERTCNPLWSNVFGCKEGDTVWIHQDSIQEHEKEPTFLEKLKNLFSAEQYNADATIQLSWKGIMAVMTGLTIVSIVGFKMASKGKEE